MNLGQSRSSRLVIGFAATSLILALAMRFSIWLGNGGADWPATFNLVGVLVLMVGGLLKTASERVRIAFVISALALILPSSFFFFSRLI